MSDPRKLLLEEWIKKTKICGNFSLVPLSGDASFRRYFRVQNESQSWVAMDAPPTLEKCDSFIKVAKAFSNANISVPKVFASDLANGFLLLSDFGDRLYVKELSTANAEELYLKTFAPLIQIQHCRYFEQDPLPLFNHSEFLFELEGFKEWFLEKYLKISFNEEILRNTFEFLIQEALSQPQVCVHRDYHSRNLMLLENNSVGILDFQDAVIGPITYDLVSLLRDCYIDWPSSQVEKWISLFFDLLKQETLSNSFSIEQFIRWFDLMGVQRHLKAIFIFARKYLRDGNSFYLNDIPRALNYILNVTSRYEELSQFNQELKSKINY